MVGVESDEIFVCLVWLSISFCTVLAARSAGGTALGKQHGKQRIRTGHIINTFVFFSISNVF